MGLVALSDQRPSAFEALTGEHGPALRSLALRLCRTPHDAHDLVQDTLERGFRSYHRLTPGSNVRAWLLSILRNRFVDHCRRGLREEPVSDAGHDVAAAGDADPEPGWAAITTEQLQAAVNQLPADFRDVYQLHSIEGRSYAEIALRLGLPKNTVGTRLIRARRKLRALLLPHLRRDEE